jgi:hypothetical protein
MPTNTQHAGWGAALFVLFIVAAMLYSKSAKSADVEEAAATEMTASISH